METNIISYEPGSGTWSVITGSGEVYNQLSTIHVINPSQCKTFITNNGDKYGRLVVSGIVEVVDKIGYIKGD